jgi:pyruvate/2-oxoglutarate dehydrogenase complex dihydrolipoamide acyltransferase (E2) component
MAESYQVVGKSRYFNIYGGMTRENRSDDRVRMINLVDLSSAERLRRQFQEATGVRPSYTALVVKAVSRALHKHPHANRIVVGFWFWKRIIQLAHVDMTVMVERDMQEDEQPESAAMPRGMDPRELGDEQVAFAATMRGTDQRDLVSITKELRELSEATPETCPRWRQFKWIVENLPYRLALWVLFLPRWTAKLWLEHRGGAVMISSPAKYGVDLMVADWPWPLGISFGLVKDRPVVEEGAIVARRTMYLTLSFDRRLMAGAPGAQFMNTICKLLENAEKELAPNQEAGGKQAGQPGQPALNP